MRRLWLFLAGLLVCVSSALAMAPATWWDYCLAWASQDKLMLVPSSGNFWKGSGTLQALLPEGRVSTLARVAWQFDFSALYRGRLGLSIIDSDSGQNLLVARVTQNRVEIEALHLSLPVSWLGHYSATIRDAGLSGQLSVGSEHFELDRSSGHGQAEVIWRGADSQLVSIRNLGDYRLGLDLAGQDVSFALSTLKGVVNLQGDGKWHFGQRPTINILARPAPELAKSLAPMLGMFGKDMGDGSYRIVPMM